MKEFNFTRISLVFKESKDYNLAINIEIKPKIYSIREIIRYVKRIICNGIKKYR